MIFWTITGTLAAIGMLALVLRAAFPLPRRAKGQQLPIPPGPPGRIAASVARLREGRGGGSGIVLLDDGFEAFAYRIAFTRAATSTIDIQSYIWRGDLTGLLLLAELVGAADRGVRVRLLIDDNPTAGLDAMWAAASAHPSIEVRLFNPLTIRRPRVLNYLFAPLRLNRRMHNKSMTFDGAVTIVGGRNVGDEYFGARATELFIDLDALAVGDVADAVADDFERYWNSASSFPAEALLKAAPDGAIAALRDPVYPDPHQAQAFRAAANEIAVAHDPGSLAAKVEWAEVRLVSDNPDKALERARRSELLMMRILPLIASARERLDLVSGYFVPARIGTRIIAGRARAGVVVRVVTNSYRVTDVSLVHAGYAPRRRRLLASGVALYEAMPVSLIRRPRRERRKTRFSGGGESVHAKAFAIDGKTLFVGSFNFDPRSALLNCEMGFIIESPLLAQGFGETLDLRLPEMAYRVELGPRRSLIWRDCTTGECFETEPNTTPFDRIKIAVLSRLPIEWLL